MSTNFRPKKFPAVLTSDRDVPNEHLLTEKSKARKVRR